MHNFSPFKKAFSLRLSRAFFAAYAVPIVLGWLLLVLIVCVLPTSAVIQPNIAHLDKLVHGLMYFVPSCLLAAVARINWKWIVFLVAVGLAIELIQSLLAYRSGDLYDGCANALGVLLGWGIGTLIHKGLRID